MDAEKLVEEIMAVFGCDRPTARTIAEQATKHHEDRNSEKTASDWISHMEDSGRSDPISAWNWAVSIYDASDWEIGSDDSGESPYKIE